MTLVAALWAIGAFLFLLGVLIDWAQIRNERQREAFDFQRLGTDAPHIRPMGVRDLDNEGLRELVVPEDWGDKD